jgi:hypothetical protein
MGPKSDSESARPGTYGNIGFIGFAEDASLVVVEFRVSNISAKSSPVYAPQRPAERMSKYGRRTPEHAAGSGAQISIHRLVPKGAVVQRIGSKGSEVQWSADPSQIGAPTVAPPSTLPHSPPSPLPATRWNSTNPLQGRALFAASRCVVRSVVHSEPPSTRSLLLSAPRSFTPPFIAFVWTVSN